MRPRAKQDGLLVHTLFDGEMVVYDMATHRAHCLNPLSALVWRNCNGSTIPEIAGAVSNQTEVAIDEPTLCANVT